MKPVIAHCTWSWPRPKWRVSVGTAPWLRSNNGDSCRTAALGHHGVILQPTFLVNDDLVAGTLVELMPEYRSVELGIYAVYPTRKQVTHKVRALIDFLAERFAPQITLW